MEQTIGKPAVLDRIRRDLTDDEMDLVRSALHLLLVVEDIREMIPPTQGSTGQARRAGVCHIQLAGQISSRGTDLPDQIQIGDAGQEGLDATTVAKRNGDLLVRPRQLGRDDDAVTEAGMPNAIAVAKLPLSGDARAGRYRWTSLRLRLGMSWARRNTAGPAAARQRSARRIQAAGSRTRVVSLSLSTQVSRRTERLARPRGPRRSPSGPKSAGTRPDRRPEPTGRSPAQHEIGVPLANVVVEVISPTQLGTRHQLRGNLQEEPARHREAALAPRSPMGRVRQG